MNKIETKKKPTLQQYAKAVVLPIQNGLQKFSNNIVIKSLVSGFVSAMPIVLVSSFFILIYAIPEAIDPNLVNVYEFAGFKAFAVRAYQFTYGILGLVVTGNIARAMMEELNLKLPFNKKVRTFNVLITAMIAYFIMSAIPTGDFNPALDSWFDGIGWNQMGAQGILPGIFVGLTTPLFYYYCYKYNITIRLPKAVPGVISQSFLAVIPFAMAVLVWSWISYVFIIALGQPFIPWFFEQLSAVIPQLKYNGEVITAEQFENLPLDIQEQVANAALSSFSNSYGMIVLYRFLETFSWFMGVHPEAIQGVFESMMAVNQEMNVVFERIGRPESFAFVNSLMGPTGNMGGTGATFVVPIICLMFARSTQSKIAGKTSAIPVAFQVNEPILFGQPIVLNPYFFVPFIFVPIINSVMAKVFVDNFGLMAARMDLPWSIPWFIRGPVAQLAQPMMFLLLLICFATSFAIYLPFVLWYDKALVKLEIENVGKQHFVSMNGIQYQLNKMLSYDSSAHKQYQAEKKKLNLTSDKLNPKQLEIARQDLYKNYNQKTVKNLFSIFTKIQSSKTIKANEKYNNQVINVTNELQTNVVKMEAYNAKLDAKIEGIKQREEIFECSYQDKIDLVLAKKIKNPKKITLEHDFSIDHKIKLKKIDIEFEIRKNIIISKRTKDEKIKANCSQTIENLKKQLDKFITETKNQEINNLKTINKSLALYKNPFNLVDADDNVKDDGMIQEDLAKEVKDSKSINVLVLCIGAGTSAMLANAINDGAKTMTSYKIDANALAYDQYKEALKGVDLVITSPQLGAYLPTIQADAKALNIKVAPTKGKQYIDLSNNPKSAAQFAIDQFEGKQ